LSERTRFHHWAIARERWQSLLEALVWLAWSGIQVRYVPFKRWAPQLGASMQETRPDATPGTERAVRDVRLAVRLVAARLPWSSSCLVRAIAARRMLCRRGLACTLYLGLNRQGRPLQAHAWLRSGHLYVTGQREAAAFSVVAYFGSAPTLGRRSLLRRIIDRFQSGLSRHGGRQHRVR
jgi:hypothetical protein